MRRAASGVAVALIAFAAVGLSACPGFYSEALPEQAEKHRVKTADGWELSLVRYAPVGEKKGRPVILCHGISANERNMDLDKDHSIARWMAAQGREAWTLSLRGTGLSDGIDEEKGRKAGYDFDTFWKEDLTAAIAYVKEKNGGQDVDYVGHSMGGMLVYAYLSQGGTGLHAVATLGSPTRFNWSRALDTALVEGSKLLIGKEAAIPVVSSAHLVLPLHGELDGDPFQLILYNPKNVTPATWKRLIAIGIADISGALAIQLLAMFETGKFESADGKIDYRADMAKVKTPVLVVAGKADRIAITPAVRDGYRALGGKKQWLLIAEENGAEHDYGHMDLVVGERAATEVWSKVLAFLSAQP